MVQKNMVRETVLLQRLNQYFVAHGDSSEFSEAAKEYRNNDMQTLQ